MSYERKIKVGITQGDINGIGYEVILKTLSDARMLELCIPIVYGSSKVAAYHRKALDMPAVPFNNIKSAVEAKDNMNNIVEVLGDDAKVEFGNATEYAGKASYVALEKAVADLKGGNIDVLVTAPISKYSVQNENFSFPGHTEYLETNIGGGNKSLMILFNENLKVALVTTHLPVSKIAESISKDLIIEKLSVFNQSLIQDFGIIKPRIAVLSLNPHAGENGLLGSEEQDIIIPAINEANDSKILCFGPYAADGFFGSRQYEHFDGVLAMYHDQGLAPFKTIAMESGVNFTAGLPYIRTSPGHGTGFDIAGKNMASEVSFREAVYMALDLFRNREEYLQMNRSPLKKQYFDKSGDNVKLDLTKDDDSIGN